jgi:hypothetical protein
MQWKTIAAGALLAVFLALLVCHWSHFHPHLGQDFFIYRIALSKALRGKDPYLPRECGWGFIYPPPALLLLAGVCRLSPAIPGLTPTFVVSGATYSFLILSIAAAVLSVGLLAGRLDGWRLWTASLLLCSAGLVETIYIGQINAVVLLLIVIFWRAWQAERHWLASTALAAALCLKLTPIVFAILFVTRRRWKWLVAVVACTGVFMLTAECIFPSAHLSSFVESLRVFSSLASEGEWNYSLSSVIPTLSGRFSTYLPDWHLVHAAKLVALAGLLAAGYAAFAVSADALGSGKVLAAACSVVMVLAPNIVWLHHAALLIPGLWLLIAESNDCAVIALSLAALLLLQSVRCASSFLGGPPGLFVGAAQVLLFVASGLWTWRTLQHASPISSRVGRSAAGGA